MSELAALYHAHHALDADDLEFWRALAAECGGPILELGCGTGRVALPLAQAGYSVVGLDRDASMLQLFRQRIPAGLSPPPALLQADFRRFRLQSAFPLIIMPCNTFSVLGPIGQREALRVVRAHLAPGGTFVFSVPNPDVLGDLPESGEPEVEAVFPHPQSGEPVQVLSSWEREADAVTFRWHYDCLAPNGETRRHTLEARHFIQSPQAVMSLVEEAGLMVAQCFGDYARRPFHPGAPWLILRAGNSRG